MSQQDNDSIGSVDLNAAAAANNDDDENSGTPMMPYGNMAGQVAHRIQEVRLHHPTMDHLRDFRDAEGITVRGNSLTLQDANILAQRLRSDPTLTSLCFDDCVTSPAVTLVFDAIGDSSTLKKIRFNDSHTLDEVEITTALRRNQTLEHIGFYYTPSMQDLTHILETSMPSSLLSLIICECDMDPHWETRLARGLRDNNNHCLEDVRIVTPTSTTSQEEMLQLLESLSHLPLKVLTLMGFDFSETVQESLGSILLNLKSTLETLKLRRNDISTTGAASLATFLSEAKCLKRLKLSRNNRIGDAGMMQLLQQHATTCRLHELEMNCVGLTDVGMEALMGQLLPSMMPCLTSLSMIQSTPTCQHTSDGIQCFIAGLLQHNYSLVNLSMWPEHNPTLGFLLRANKAGRGQLLQGGMEELPLAIWPIILERTQRYGSDVLFSFFREAQPYILR